MAVAGDAYRAEGEVGGCFVRIRPFVAERDARALEALHTLCRSVTAAFDQFYADLAADDAPALSEGDRHAA